MKVWRMLVVVMLMAGPVFAEATKAELVQEYNRLETLKQIILRQADILAQVKKIEATDILKNTDKKQKKKEK